MCVKPEAGVRKMPNAQKLHSTEVNTQEWESKSQENVVQAENCLRAVSRCVPEPAGWDAAPMALRPETQHSHGPGLCGQ